MVILYYKLLPLAHTKFRKSVEIENIGLALEWNASNGTHYVARWNANERTKKWIALENVKEKRNAPGKQLVEFVEKASTDMECMERERTRKMLCCVYV